MRKIQLPKVAFYLTLLLFSCCSGSYDYNIQKYELTFEPRKGSTDVKATIEIAYLLNGTVPKSDGFKFLGTSRVDSLICYDETGVIQSKVDYLKETKISWAFKSVHSGLKKIKATFVLKGFAQKEGEYYAIEAPWTGVFKVPVNKSAYTVLFPSPPGFLEFKKPAHWQKQPANGTYCYYFPQSPLAIKTISFKYKL